MNLSNRSIFFILFCWLISIHVSAQVTVSGKVLSETTNLPVSNASVYFNNTSIGTQTNDKGEFVLHDVRSFNSELIVSCVGYELIVFKTTAEQTANKSLVFKMPVKEEALKDVLIVSNVVRQKWLKIFRDNFLGITEEAERSTIKNMADIYFTRGNNKNGIHANSDEPLIIINEMLGYKMTFQLIDFSFDNETSITYFYGYTRYEELGTKKRWTRNRQRAYYGSSVHFYRSLIKDSLKQEGFSIYVLKKMKEVFSDTTKSDVLTIPKPKEKNNEIQVAVTVTASQIIKADTVAVNKYRLTVDGMLMVQYDKNPGSKAYLQSKTLIQGNLKNGYRAYVKLMDGTLLIDNNGIIDNPMGVQYSGYWMYEKAANLLPFNYVPGE